MSAGFEYDAAAMVAEWAREAAVRVVRYRAMATDDSFESEVRQAWSQMAAGGEDAVIGYANNLIRACEESNK